MALSSYTDHLQCIIGRGLETSMLLLCVSISFLMYDGQNIWYTSVLYFSYTTRQSGRKEATASTLQKVSVFSATLQITSVLSANLPQTT